jgi:hypothetical protein
MTPGIRQIAQKPQFGGDLSVKQPRLRLRLHETAALLT